MSILSEGIETDNDQRTTNKGILIGGANIYGFDVFENTFR